MITKTAMALAGVLAAAPVLVPSTASAQIAVQVQPPVAQCQWAQLADGSWACVPDAPQTYVYNQTPYVYYYAPNIGWGWHVSPWGYGHPWRGRYVGHYAAPRYYGGHVVAPRYYGGAHVAPRYYGGHVQHYGGSAHYRR